MMPLDVLQRASAGASAPRPNAAPPHSTSSDFDELLSRQLTTSLDRDGRGPRMGEVRERRNELDQRRRDDPPTAPPVAHPPLPTPMARPDTSQRPDRAADDDHAEAGNVTRAGEPQGRAVAAAAHAAPAAAAHQPADDAPTGEPSAVDAPVPPSDAPVAAAIETDPLVAATLAAVGSDPAETVASATAPAAATGEGTTAAAEGGPDSAPSPPVAVAQSGVTPAATTAVATPTAGNSANLPNGAVTAVPAAAGTDREDEPFTAAPSASGGALGAAPTAPIDPKVSKDAVTTVPSTPPVGPAVVAPPPAARSGASVGGTAATGPAGPAVPAAAAAAVESAHASGAAPTDGKRPTAAATAPAPTPTAASPSPSPMRLPGARVSSGQPASPGMAGPAAAPEPAKPPALRVPGSMHLDLDLGAEGLGAMRLRASTVAGELHLSLTASDAHVRSTLAGHAGELRRELESSGLGPASLDVGGSPNGGHEPHRRESDGPTGDGTSPSPRTAERSTGTRPPATTPGRRIAGSARLDLML